MSIRRKRWRRRGRTGMRAAARIILILLAILLAPAAVRTASAESRTLQGRPFAYPKTLKTGDGGASLRRLPLGADINQRDEIPEKECIHVTSTSRHDGSSRISRDR